MVESIRGGGDQFCRFKSKCVAHPDQNIYRVALDVEGVFFAVISDDLCAITILPHDSMVKRTAKAKPKYLTSPWWRAGSGAKTKRRKRPGDPF